MLQLLTAMGNIYAELATDGAGGRAEALAVALVGPDGAGAADAGDVR